jgi:GTP pyrophosphokinase
MDPARKIQVEWTGNRTTDSFHKCYICIRTQDKPGVLAEVTNVLSSTGANVHKAEAKVSEDLTGVLEFELGIRNLKHLELVTARLESIPAVVSVRRKNIVKQRRIRRGRL